MPLTIIRVQPDGDERRILAHGIVTGARVHFPVDTDVDVGDLAEDALPSGQTKTMRFTIVNVYRSPFPGADQLDHIEADWEPLTRRPVPARRPISVTSLHQAISEVAGSLYDDGHYSRAVLAAMQAVEHRVMNLTGIDKSGSALMADAFGGPEPILQLSDRAGRSGKDERDGLRLMFMGAMIGVRNPRAHGDSQEDPPDQALECLALASLFMRRLDGVRSTKGADA